jgi:hypothetical protein
VLNMQVAEEELSAEEAKERKIMKLLLKVKNGTPPQRKSALRQLSDKARDFGAGPLFNQILPLLMSPTLEDQERHLLVKVMPSVPKPRSSRQGAPSELFLGKKKRLVKESFLETFKETGGKELNGKNTVSLPVAHAFPFVSAPPKVVCEPTDPAY